MSEERRQVLEMVAEGKITIDEAERLLSAMGESTSITTNETTEESSDKPKPKYFRVVVESSDGKSEGQAKVNIKVPIKILRAGVKLAALLPDQAQDKVNEAMEAKGIKVNLSDLNGETMDEFIEGLSDFNIDVNEGKDKVRLYCE